MLEIPNYVKLSSKKITKHDPISTKYLEYAFI